MSGNEDDDGDAGNARLRHAHLAHATIRALPANLDTKATFFAGLLAAVLVFQYKSFDPEIFKVLHHLDQPDVLIPAYLYLLLTGVALVFCYMVVKPRSGGQKDLLLSYVSFAHRRRPADVLHDFTAYDTGRSEEAILTHCHELAQLSRRKTFWLNLAFFTGAAALFVFVYLQVMGLSGAQTILAHYQA